MNFKEWPVYEVVPRRVWAARIVRVEGRDRKPNQQETWVSRKDGEVWIENPITGLEEVFIPSFQNMYRLAEVGGYATIETRVQLRTFVRQGVFEKGFRPATEALLPKPRIIRVSDDDVRSIRERLAAGEKARDLAREFAVSEIYIRHIKTGRARGNVT